MEHCTVCGRRLKNPVSVLRKMGPVCYKKWQGNLCVQQNLSPYLELISSIHSD